MANLTYKPRELVFKKPKIKFKIEQIVLLNLWIIDWKLKPKWHKWGATQFHYIGQKADIFTVKIFKLQQLTPKHYSWIQGTTGQYVYCPKETAWNVVFCCSNFLQQKRFLTRQNMPGHIFVLNSPRYPETAYNLLFSLIISSLLLNQCRWKCSRHVTKCVLLTLSTEWLQFAARPLTASHPQKSLWTQYCRKIQADTCHIVTFKQE